MTTIVPYRFATSFSDGSLMIPCGIQWASEVADAVDAGLIAVTNLGQKASPEHMRASPVSRHNPMPAPNGKKYVCALDYGGRDYPTVFEFHRVQYVAKNPRIYTHGFGQRGDGYGTRWYDGGIKRTDADFGHAHTDFTMRYEQLGTGTGWFADELLDTTPFGFVDWLTGHVNPLDHLGGFLMALTDQQQTDILNAITRLDGDRQWTTPAITRLDATLRRGDPPQRTFRADGTTAVFRGGPGVWEHIPDEVTLNRQVAIGLVSEAVTVVTAAELDLIRDGYLAVGQAAFSDDALARLTAAVVAVLRNAGTSTTALDDASVTRVVAALVATLRQTPVTIGGAAA